MSVNFKETFQKSVGVSPQTTEVKGLDSEIDFKNTFYQSVKKKVPTPASQDQSNIPSVDLSNVSVENPNDNAFTDSLKKYRVQGRNEAAQAKSESDAEKLGGSQTSLKTAAKQGGNAVFKKDTHIYTPNGLAMPLDHYKVDDNLPTDDYNSQVSALQERINSGTTTPRDINAVATLTNKTPEAAAEYIAGNTTKGAAIDNVDEQNKIKGDLSNAIYKYNESTGEDVKPEDVLSSADKTAEFIQKVKQQKANVLKKGFDVSEKLNVDPQNTELQKQNADVLGTGLDPESFLNKANQYQELLKQHVAYQTVIEDEKNGVPKEQTLKNISRRLDPREYYKNIKANIPSVATPLNPGAAAGDIYDKIFGTQDKDELLNSQKGVAEFAYNDQQKRIANNEISQGVLNNDDALVNQGKARMDATQSSDKIYQDYPSLLKSKIAQEVSKELAFKAGQLEANQGEVVGDENNDKSLKWFGATIVDIAKTAAFQKYYNDPKTKDIAQNMLENPKLFSDASYLGGATSAFAQPFVDLFGSIGDITQFRNNKDVISDIKKDELFPKETPNVVSDFNILGHPFKVRTVLNTTANLAGMMATAIGTEGVATELGASASTAKSLGTYTSFGLPSYDGALKDSYNFLNNDAARTLYATMTAVTNAEGGRFLDLGKIARIPGVSEEFAKIADGISNESISQKGVKELLDNAKNTYIDFAVKYGKNVSKGAATMAYFNISNNIEKVAFGDPNTKPEDILPQAGHAFMDGILGMSIMGAFGATSDMRNEKNTTYKGNIYNMALNHDAAKDVFDIGLQNGTYTQDQYNEKIQILNTAKAAKNALDAAQQETNTTLDQNQKSVFVANKTAESVLREKANVKGTSEDNATKYTEQADRLREQSTQTLDGLKFTPTLIPLYDLYHSEKSYDVALSDFNGNTESQQVLEETKNHYDNLVNKYFQNEYKPENEEIEPRIKNTGVTISDLVKEYENDYKYAMDAANNGYGSKETVDAAKEKLDLAVSYEQNDLAKKSEKQLITKPDISDLSDEEVKKAFNRATPQLSEDQVSTLQPVFDNIDKSEGINEKELSDAQNVLYDALDKNEGASHLIEPLIKKLQDYGHTAETKTVSTSEKVPIEGSFGNRSKQPEIRPALEHTIGSEATITDSDGNVKTGTLNVKGGSYVLDMKDGPQIVLGEKAITDRDISLPDKEQVPIPVKFNENGDVESITLQLNKVDTENGGKVADKTITIKPKDQENALNLAIHLQAEAIGTIPDEVFDKAYETVTKEIPVEVLKKQPSTEKVEPKEESKNKTQSDTLSLLKNLSDEDWDKVKKDAGFGSRTNIVEDDVAARYHQAIKIPESERTDEQNKIIKAVDDISSQSKPIKNGNEKNGKNANEKESSNQQSERRSEKQNGESGKESSHEQDLLNKDEGKPEPDAGSGAPPEKGKVGEDNADNNDEFVSVRKEKLQEIEGAKKLFESRTKKKWDEIYDSAMKNLQKMYPKKSLYDAMLSRVNDFARRLAAGELFNPTSEDIAVFNVFRAETQKRINDVEGLDSDNNFERLRAIQELDNLNHDLLNIARVTNPEGEAGRAFGMHKSEVALDEDNGLKIRNMQMIKANGGQKLSPEDSKWVADKWNEEKELMKQEQAAKEKSMRDDFDNRIAEIEKDYEEKIVSLSKGKGRDKTVKQKTLSQKGKDIADQIRKLKKPKDGANLDFTLGTWDLAVETVAQLVEKGSTVAEAIQKMIDDGIVAFREDKDKDEFENRLFDQLKNKKDIGESLDAIKTFAAENDVKDITTDMVKNNLIRDYINAHVTEVDKKDLLDKSFKDLKEVLPNITKERFVEAYLKEGEFKQPTQKQLEGGIKEQENELKRIARQELTADQQQKIKLEREKKQTEQNIKEYKRKLADGEFEEKQPVKLKKQDAELIQLRRKQAGVEEQYRKKQKELEQKNKTGLELAADFIRSSYIAWLIGKPVTLAKVGAMSIVRPVSEAVTKLTAGKAFDAMFPGISKVAKRGGESTSLRSLESSLGAYIKQMGPKGMENMYDKAEEQYNKAAKEYTSYENSSNPDAKKLKELKDKMNGKLLKVQGTFLYKFIGVSSLKDALTALVNRSNIIERQFGHVEGENINDAYVRDDEHPIKASLKAGLGEFNYILGFIGRSHSALKTFSGRASFAGGFMARLEGAMQNGEDINSGNKILEIAHESYLDWERGKYQQANQITDLWNKMTNHITDGEVGGERELTAKAMAALLKTEVAITRVPVNILHESLMEYTLGAFRALYKVGKVNKEIKNQLKGEGIDPNSPEFRDALKERINQMDVNEAATIARAFRKGGLGVGLYALALVTGAAHFGIFPHMGQKKKKDEADLKPDELNPGQVMVGGHKFGEVVSSLIEHVPALWTTFMGLGMAQSYNDEIKKGKTTKEAALESLLTHLSIISHSIPQTKVIDAIGLSKEIHQTVKKGLQNMGVIRSTNIDYSKEELKDPALKSIVDKGVELPTVKPNSIHIKDEKSLTEKKLSEYGTEKVKEFTESRKKFFHEELVKEQQKNTAYIDKFGNASLHAGAGKTATAFNKLNKDQLKDIISDLSTKATKKAKKEVFNDSTSHN